MDKDTTSGYRHSVNAPLGERWAETLHSHRRAQRDEILDAALTLLAERGMAGLTMSALAERAGVSRATLYHYFPRIDHVLAAWVGREVEATVDQILARAGQEPDPLERLRWLIEAQVVIFARREHRLSVEHLETEAGSPLVRQAVSQGLEPLRELVASTLTEAGALGSLPEGFPPEAAADLVLGILGALRRHVVADRLPPGQAVAAAWGLLRSGWLGGDAREEDHGAAVTERRSTAGTPRRSAQSLPSSGSSRPPRRR
jgi:AcrR family transcriptional regulator